MAKNGSKSAFDEILEKFGSDEDRTTFLGLAEKLPDLKESLLRQSDYSRAMEENRQKLITLSKWDSWANDNWVPDKEDPSKGYTKRELQALNEAEELKAEKERLAQLVEFGGIGDNEMDFAEIEKWGKEFVGKQGFVTQESIDKEKKQLLEYANGLNQFTARAAVDVPYLNQKHAKEFGDLFDPQDFLKAANEKNRTDLRDFYEKEYVVEARQNKMKEAFEAEKKQLVDQYESKIQTEKQLAEERLHRVSGANASPTDGGESSMSPLQKNLMGIKDDKADDIPTVPLGTGSAAAVAAARFRETGTV